MRLRYAMLIQEEIEVQEKDLTHALEHKKHLKVRKVLVLEQQYNFPCT